MDKQLVCEGQPGQGYVGLDIGPLTVAGVGETDAFLKQFCAELASRQCEVCRLQRRANNPDGTINRDKKTWHTSGRQCKTRTKLHELGHKQAAHRHSLYGKLVNQIMRMGAVIQLEKLSYRVLQRRFGKSVGMRTPGMLVEQL